MNRPAVRDAALLALRVVLGAICVAHGYRWWFQLGMAQSARQFQQWGVPQPRVSAYVAGSIELIAGALLIIGLLTTLMAGLLALIAALTLYLVNIGSGFFIQTGGMEYTLLIIVSLVIIIVFGAGRASFDGVLARD